jgi:DNA-binding NtrC family response regulator
MVEIKPVILVVDDETNIRESFSLILDKEFKVVTAASGEAALKRIIDEKVDLVYLDIRMPGMNGMETLKRIKEIDNGVEVIMVTALNDVGGAAAAIKMGAKDYIVKPFDVKDIQNRTRSFVIKAQTKAIRQPMEEELIGNSRQVQAIRKVLEQLPQKDSSVLIVGENGLEAEQIAAIINGESEKELKKLDASPSTGSAVLFGCEKGSFTSEFGKETGMLEESNGGILFIRNIELLSLEIQKKLGQAILKKEYSRDGSTATTHIDVRIIAETSSDLSELVKEGGFDRDLYNAITRTVIELPPLRARESDIPLLIAHYVDKFSIKYDRKLKVSPEALEVMVGYSWPGNLAELSNLVEAVILSLGKEVLEPDDLPLDILIKSPAGGRPYTTLENIEGRFEKAHILSIYKKAGESKEKASAILGIGLKTLESKLESINA